MAGRIDGQVFRDSGFSDDVEIASVGRVNSDSSVFIEMSPLDQFIDGCELHHLLPKEELEIARKTYAVAAKNIVSEDPLMSSKSVVQINIKARELAPEGDKGYPQQFNKDYVNPRSPFVELTFPNQAPIRAVEGEHADQVAKAAKEFALSINPELGEKLNLKMLHDMERIVLLMTTQIPYNAACGVDKGNLELLRSKIVQDYEVGQDFRTKLEVQLKFKPAFSQMIVASPVGISTVSHKRKDAFFVDITSQIYTSHEDLVGLQSAATVVHLAGKVLCEKTGNEEEPYKLTISKEIKNVTFNTK